MDKIRDFILTTSVEDANEENALAPKRPIDVDYSIVFASGPDFAVRRKTKASSKVLVFLVSQSQYYIKDEKKGTIEEFSSAGYTRFMSDCMEQLPLEEETGDKCGWLSVLERGKAFADTLADMIRKFNADAELRSAVLHNWLHVEPYNLYRSYNSKMSHHIAATETVIRKVLSVCEEYAPKEEIKRVFSELALSGARATSKAGSALCSILERHQFGYRPPAVVTTFPQSVAEILMEEYGLSGLEEILREYFRVAICTFPSYRYLFDLFHVCRFQSHNYTAPQIEGNERRRFKLKEFNHYLWYQSVYQGYANDVLNFVTSWVDSLRMQEMIYGKITDKYPANLASCEKKLSFKYLQIKAEIDERMWEKQVETMSSLEYKGKTYSMICPKTPTDVVDEAQQQSNCVASYVKDILNGACMIFFCRYTKTPDRSLVTVEIRADGSLGQVKARFNREPSPDAREFVEKWYNDVVMKSELWQQAAAA